MLKKTYLIILTALLLVISGCGEHVDSVEPDNLSATITSNTNQPNGTSLTHAGNGIWYGHFAGAAVWFQGITPEQIQQGLKSQWNVTEPFYSSSYIVSGNGNQFTVSWAACADMSVTTETIKKFERHYFIDGSGQTVYYNSLFESTSTRQLPTMSNGQCQLEYSAKIIVYNGVPGIYEMDSYVPDEDYPVLEAPEPTDPEPTDPEPTDPVEVIQGVIEKSGYSINLTGNADGLVQVIVTNLATSTNVEVISKFGNITQKLDGSFVADFTITLANSQVIRYRGRIWPTLSL